MQWRIKYESRLKRNIGQLIELIEERMHFMYGRLDDGEAIKHIAHGKYGVEEEYYAEKYSSAIIRAKSYHIWSFE